MNLNSFKIKYEKYKSKYLSLKKQFGGECDPMPNRDETDFNAGENLSALQPNERITIQGRCYKLTSLYKWIITHNNDTLPQTANLITDVERQVLINVYRSSNILTREKLMVLYPGLFTPLKI